jgi:predicted GNAT family N-acyltransferase
MSDNEFEVKVAKTDEEKERIFQLRYQIYIEEMGKSNKNADHDKKIIKDLLDDWGTLFYIEKKRQMVATIRINSSSDGKFSEEFMDIYKVEHFIKAEPIKYSFSSRLMVHKDRRNSKVTSCILNNSYKFFRDNKIRFNFLNCSSSLLQLYQNLGCRRYAENFIDSDVGLRTPLVLLTEDIVHLRNVRSIYYKIAKKYENNFEDGPWFERAFSKYIACITGKPSESDQPRTEQTDHHMAQVSL